jgi:hypothetical protein
MQGTNKKGSKQKIGPKTQFLSCIWGYLTFTIIQDAQPIPSPGLKGLGVSSIIQNNCRQLVQLILQQSEVHLH